MSQRMAQLKPSEVKVEFDLGLGQESNARGRSQVVAKTGNENQPRRNNNYRDSRGDNRGDTRPRLNVRDRPSQPIHTKADMASLPNLSHGNILRKRNLAPRTRHSFVRDYIREQKEFQRIKEELAKLHPPPAKEETSVPQPIGTESNVLGCNDKVECQNECCQGKRDKCGDDKVIQCSYDDLMQFAAEGYKISVATDGAPHEVTRCDKERSCHDLRNDSVNDQKPVAGKSVSAGTQTMVNNEPRTGPVQCKPRSVGVKSHLETERLKGREKEEASFRVESNFEEKLYHRREQLKKGDGNLRTTTEDRRVPLELSEILSPRFCVNQSTPSDMEFEKSILEKPSPTEVRLESPQKTHAGTDALQKAMRENKKILYDYYRRQANPRLCGLRGDRVNLGEKPIPKPAVGVFQFRIEDEDQARHRMRINARVDEYRNILAESRTLLTKNATAFHRSKSQLVPDESDNIVININSTPDITQITIQCPDE